MYFDCPPNLHSQASWKTKPEHHTSNPAQQCMSVLTLSSPHLVTIMDQGGVMWSSSSFTSLVHLHSESRWLLAYDVALMLLMVLVAYPYFSHYLGKDAGRLKAEMAQVRRDLQAAQVSLPGTLDGCPAGFIERHDMFAVRSQVPHQRWHPGATSQASESGMHAAQKHAPDLWLSRRGEQPTIRHLLQRSRILPEGFNRSRSNVIAWVPACPHHSAACLASQPAASF